MVSNDDPKTQKKVANGIRHDKVSRRIRCKSGLSTLFLFLGWQWQDVGEVELGQANDTTREDCCGHFLFLGLTIANASLCRKGVRQPRHGLGKSFPTMERDQE